MLGILRLGTLSALPSSPRHFGNVLTLATPDSQQRVGAYQLVPGKEAVPTSDYTLTKTATYIKSPAPVTTY